MLWSELDLLELALPEDINFEEWSSVLYLLLLGLRVEVLWHLAPLVASKGHTCYFQRYCMYSYSWPTIKEKHNTGRAGLSTPLVQNLGLRDYVIYRTCPYACCACDCMTLRVLGCCFCKLCSILAIWKCFCNNSFYNFEEFWPLFLRLRLGALGRLDTLPTLKAGSELWTLCQQTPCSGLCFNNA